MLFYQPEEYAANVALFADKKNIYNLKIIIMKNLFFAFALMLVGTFTFASNVISVH